MKFCTTAIETKTISISANNLGLHPFSNEYYIHYPNVFEVFQDGSYIHYTYSSLLDTPDDNNVHYSIKGMAGTVYSLSSGQLAEKYNIYILNDMSLFRGKLLSKMIYSADKKRKMTELYTYNIADAKKKHNISVKSVPLGMVAYKKYLTDCLLIKKETIDENNVSQVIDYKYNLHNLLSEASFVRSDGKRQISKFTYPFEITYGLNATTYKQMTDKHILSNYVDKIIYLNNGHVIAGEHRKFSTSTTNVGVLRPSEIHLLDKNDTITLNNLYKAGEKKTVEAHFKYNNNPNQSPDIQEALLYIDDRYMADATIDFNYSINTDDLSDVLTLSIYRMKDNDWVPEEHWTHKESTNTFENSGGYTCIGNYDSNTGKCTRVTKQIVLAPGYYRISITSDKHKRGYGEPCWSGDCTITAIERSPTIDGGEFTKPEVYYTYDEVGNIREVRPAGVNTVYTTYLWGYKYRYLIAKIKNASYADVTGKISASTLTTLANKVEPTIGDWYMINNLRTQLPNAMITTYTYKPLVGVSTITDPRWLKTTYNYDSFNRLMNIKDHNGKTIESYEYNYKQ